jgi:hypothetical protein
MRSAINSTDDEYVLATQLSKHFRNKRGAGENGWLLSFPEEQRLPMSFPYDVSTVVERWGVFCQPVCDLPFPTRR